MDKYTKKKLVKKEAILEGARHVFSDKGFIGVTMKDIIEECGISRGGIYLYFSSVDEVFTELLKQRTATKFDTIREKIKENIEFDKLLDDYLASQKERLLKHVEASLLRAAYEYYFSHKTENARTLQQEQLTSTKQTILEILKLGVNQKVIGPNNLSAIAEHFMFVIEGLSILALTGDIDEKKIDNQFEFIKQSLQ